MKREEIRIHEPCGGKIVRTKDGPMCACGVPRRPRVVGAVYAGGLFMFDAERMSPEDVAATLELIEEGEV